MFWSKWIINLVLACLVAFFGTKIYRVWSEPTRPVVKATRVSPKKRVKPKARRVVQHSRVRPESSYQVVVDKNLFSPERKGPEPGPEGEKVKEPDKEEKLPANILLYGVVVTGNYRKALLTNPDRSKDKRQFVWVSVGDTLGDYKLADIQSEKVFLEKGGKRYEVSLYAGKKRRTPPRPRKSTRASLAPRTTKKKKTIPAPRTIVKPKKRTLKKGAYEIIKTPFGNIKRRK